MAGDKDPGEVDERDLIEGAKSGNRESFQELYRRKYGSVHACCRRLLGGGEVADVVQTVFTKALVHIATFDPEKGRFDSWLLGIARNACLDEGRGRARQVARLGTRVSLEAAPEMKGEPSPEDLALALEYREVLDRCLTQLPDDLREVMVLRYMDELTLQEVADILGIPIGTAASKAARAIRRLADLLRDSGFSEEDGEVMSHVHALNHDEARE